MPKTAKSKKKSPANKKRSPKQNQKRPLLPAFFFLFTICSLIAIFYLYNNFTALNQGLLLKSGSPSNYPAKEPATKTPKSKQLKDRSHLSQPTKINYYRLDKNYSQVRQHTKKFDQPLTQPQKARQIIHLLSFSRDGDLAPLPGKTELLRAEFTPPLITLDISRGLTNGAVNFGARDEMVALSCLTNTFLLNFPSFKYVQILIEGQKRETLAGHIDISKPLSYQSPINN